MNEDKTGQAPVETPVVTPWVPQAPATQESPVVEAPKVESTEEVAAKTEEMTGDVVSEPVLEVAPVETPVAGELVDMVTATVPKAFILRLDHFREIQFKAGVQEMERAHADHWYSKANGVTIYAPNKAAE